MNSHNINLDSVAEKLEVVRPSSLKQRLINRFQRFMSDRKMVRYSLVTINVIMLIAIAWFTLGPTYQGQPLGRQGVITPTGDTATKPLDQLSSADVAQELAIAAGMDVELTIKPVINQVYSVRAEQASVMADVAVVSKPMYVPTTFKSRYDIKEYVTKAGDTVSSVAAKFGVTSDSVIWSNGLRSTKLPEGITLLVPPINGIVYIVQPNDTVDSLVRGFRANRDLLIAYNDLEVSGLREGERILIPNGIQSSGRWSTVFGLSWGGNLYVKYQCTWHVANRRAAVGNPVPSNLGNAVSWYANAAANGIQVGEQPRQYAVMWHRNTSIAGGLGHVAFVERMNDDGSILISEMNYGNSRYDEAGYRTITPAEFDQYRFIY